MRMGGFFSRLPAAVIAAAMVAGAAPGGMAPAAAQNAAAGTVVQVNTGRGRLVTLPRPMSDLFVADDKVADVQVRSPTQLYIFGKKAGETTISATSKTGGVVFAATVRVGQNLDSIGQMLGLAMPDARIAATPMNGLVLLTGTVANPDDAAEAERLVQAYVGEGTKVLSRLKTATPLQVNLQVRIVEVSRSFGQQIGVNLTSIDGTGGFKFGIGSGRSPATTFTTDRNLPLGVGQTITGFTRDPNTGLIVERAGTALARGPGRTTIGALTSLFGLDILSAIDLGEAAGQVTTLANPNLTALSGETGTFLAGGEIPIPLAQALGTISVEFKQYGVSLAYTPTVLSDGRISLRVRPEVSELDYANAITLSGTRVPGFTTRRAETTLELGSGQSMMIGGLLQNKHGNTVDKTPFLGDLPILGALFRSQGFQRNETELVIVITPYLVKPVNNQADIALPTDGYRAPTDAARIVYGELANGVSGEQRPVPTVAPSGAAPVIGAAGVPAPLPARPTPDLRAPRQQRKGAGKVRGAVAPGFSQ